MLAIVGGKGGTGKTTTAVALASALADQGRHPLVVDADCDMPDVHDVARTPVEPGLDAVAAGNQATTRHRSGLDPRVEVVPAGRATSPGPGLERVEDGRPVLVDCPAGASPAVADALRVADESLLVATPTRESLEDAAKTAAMARTLDAPPVGAVLAKTDRARPVERLLGCPLLGKIPLVDCDPLAAKTVQMAYRDVGISLLEGKT